MHTFNPQHVFWLRNKNLKVLKGSMYVTSNTKTTYESIFFLMDDHVLAS